MDDKRDLAVVAEPTSPIHSDDEAPPTSATDIYVDPELEKACLKKFDRWLLPVAFVFLVLSSLDRNNVTELFIPAATASLTNR